MRNSTSPQRCCYKMHVRLPALYEQMPEFQHYSAALMRFNDALASVPAALDERRIVDTSCTSEFIEQRNGTHALYIQADEHEYTRTNLKAEPERLATCTSVLQKRVYYE